MGVVFDRTIYNVPARRERQTLLYANKFAFAYAAKGAPLIRVLWGAGSLIAVAFGWRAAGHRCYSR